MSCDIIEKYVCPVDHSALAWKVGGPGSTSGILRSEMGREYQVADGIPDFTHPPELPLLEVITREEYDRIAPEIYDSAMEWQFASTYQDEGAVREKMVDWLDLRPGHRVLEVGAGTGRDSFRIAQRLEAEGELFIQDLSPRMVEECRIRMRQHSDEFGLECHQRFFVSNARYLPFPDRYFDAVFHFGGLNQFADKKKSFDEFARVSKLGAKIVCGDEAVAPWLRGTEFERIVTTNNPLFSHVAPLDVLPESARDVSLHWVIANCFYVFELSVGQGAPPLDLDLAHAGSRGGTMRTRYYGQLEGVTLEAKELALRAARKRGVSMHEWLDELVRERASDELGRKAGAEP